MMAASQASWKYEYVVLIIFCQSFVLDFQSHEVQQLPTTAYGFPMDAL